MKYKIISVIMILFVLSVMNGCSSRSRNELSEQVSEITVSSDVSQKDERGYSAESSVPSDVSEEAESSYITENRVPSVVSERVEESIYVTDELFAEGFENKEFLVYKTHDNCYIEGEFVYAVNMADTDSISLKNGEFLLINADGEFYNGEVAGFMDTPMIHKINSSKKLTMQQVFEIYDYPELADIEFSYKNHIVKHTFGNHVYLILKNGSPIATTYDIYMDSELIGSFEKLDEQENLIEFVERLNKSETSW